MRSVRVAAALVGVALVAVGCAQGNGPQWNANLPGRVAAAAVNVEDAPATRYHGSVAGENGVFEFDMSVTRHGDGYGKLSGPFVAEVMTIDGELYIKGDQAYWQEQDSSKAALYANQWVHGDEVGGGVDMSLFSPNGLAEAVESAVAGVDPQKLRTAPEVEVGGKKALRVKGDDATFYISADPPHRLLRVEGSVADADELALDLDMLDADAARKLFDQLTELAKQPVHDPQVSVSFVDRKFGSCAATCQVIATVRNDSSEATVYPRMVVTITADGQSRGSCTADFAAIQPGASGTASCVVNSAAWQAWYRWARRTPGYHRYQAQFVVTVRATITATPKQPN